MQIALIELDYHAEVLTRFCHLLEGSDIALTVYTKPSVYRLVPPDLQQQHRWRIKPAGMPGWWFLLRNLREINQHKLLIFNTAASHFAPFALLPWKPPTLVRNHNTHTNFAATSHLYLPLKPYFLYKGASYIFRRHILHADWLFRPLFYQKVRWVSFLTGPIEAYAQQHGWVSPERIGPRLPIVSYEPGFAKPAPTDALWLTIPGTIDNRKKDYQLVLDALQAALPTINRPLVISLLGRPKDQFGQAVVRDFRALESAQVVVQAWEGTVPQSDFDEVMRQTDLILAPILLDTSYAIYRERYGTTKISGAVSDMIRYGKPILLPETYPLDAALLPMAFAYTDPASFAGALAAFASSYDFGHWQRQAAACLAPFTIASQKEHTQQQLRRLGA